MSHIQHGSQLNLQKLLIAIFTDICLFETYITYDLQGSIESNNDIACIKFLKFEYYPYN